MLSITDLKKGAVIQIGGTPYRVIKYDHSSMGRGGAVVRTKLRNLHDGTVLSKTFRGNDKIESAQIIPVTVQYLYQDNEQAHFMRTDSYEQISMPKELFADQIGYLKENQEVTMLYIDQRPISLELPVKADLKVVSAEPGVKGNSVSNVMKKCQTETGMTVRVPLFIEAGDTIRVDTRTGEYVERA